MKKLTAILLALVIVLALAACGGTATETTQAPQTTAEAQDATVLGEGATVFSFTVETLDGVKAVYEIHTDAATVGEALEALGLLEGEEGEYGLYVLTVDGITADWDKDQTYWAFYENGEYALTGVDVTEVSDGGNYSFVLTKG